jgi:uncharacterized membrane protein YfcA
MFQSLPWLALSGLGLAVGFLSGLLGIGGGVIMVPGLVLLLKMTQQNAQAISLAVMVPVALWGSFRYFSSPSLTFDFRVVALLVILALVGTSLGTALALYLSPGTLRKVFAVALILMGAWMLIK